MRFVIAGEAPDGAAVAERYRAAVGPEARERHALACATDAARTARWRGEPLDPTSSSGCFPLFSFSTALTAAPFDDDVRRRTIRRIGLFHRTAVVDQDTEIHARIEAIVGRELTGPPPSPGPPREELLARVAPAGGGG